MHSIYTVSFPNSATLKETFALWLNLTQQEAHVWLYFLGVHSKRKLTVYYIPSTCPNHSNLIISFNNEEASNNAKDMPFWGTQFESQLGHTLSWL
jgi:hypothetical protein